MKNENEIYKLKFAKMLRFILFSSLLILASLILLYQQRGVDLSYYCSPESEETVEASSLRTVANQAEPEKIEDFELKSWNRSKSIGFLRKSNLPITTYRIQIAANAAVLQWTERLALLSRVYQKEKTINTLEICTTTGLILTSSKRTLSSRLFCSEIPFLGLYVDRK